MKQLLRSLGRINRAKQQSDRHIQAHIFFDNGVRHSKLTQFALQLVVVAGHALGNTLESSAYMYFSKATFIHYVLTSKAC